MVPKKLYPDFKTKSGNFIEYKGSYIRDKLWWAAVKCMKLEDKKRYKVVLQNADAKSPWENITVSDWLTACGIDWAEYPHVKEEWLVDGKSKVQSMDSTDKQENR